MGIYLQFVPVQPVSPQIPRGKCGFGGSRGHCSCPDIEFLSDLLVTYDFEKTDFVYEPGQFSVRGGIIDVYSYAHEQPYRLELFGDEIENIREFDPESQLSTKELDHISLIPNVQTKLVSEERQSFLKYIPSETTIWLKDYQQSLDIIDKSFHKVEEQFQTITSIGLGVYPASGRARTNHL